MKEKHGIAAPLFIGSMASLAIAFSAPAVAAPYCKATVEGGWATGASEDEASRRAVAWWSSRAGAVGRGYENWERAAGKRVDCEDADGGLRRCKAVAAPCLPEGQEPEPDANARALEL